VLLRARQGVLTIESGEGEAVSNYWGQTILYVFLLFIICRLYNLTVSVQAQVNLLLRVSISVLV